MILRVNLLFSLSFLYKQRYSSVFFLYFSYLILAGKFIRYILFINHLMYLTLYSLCWEGA